MIESSRLTPPSSSGPGRGPLKAKTRIRIPLGAQKYLSLSSHRGIIKAKTRIRIPPPNGCAARGGTSSLIVTYQVSSSKFINCVSRGLYPAYCATRFGRSQSTLRTRVKLWHPDIKYGFQGMREGLISKTLAPAVFAKRGVGNLADATSACHFLWRYQAAKGCQAALGRNGQIPNNRRSSRPVSIKSIGL